MPIADTRQAALRRALVGAVPVHLARARRRSMRRRVAFALLASLALIGTVVTVALPDDRVDARIDVQSRDGLTVVRLLDLESRPDEIVAALRNAGIDASVDLVPVGPSNVGKFVSFEASREGHLNITEGDKYSYQTFEVDQHYPGKLVLALGRLGAEGEEWQAPSNAMARDEALSCLDLYGLTPPEATQKLAGVPVSIRWFDATTGRDIEAGQELGAKYASWRVIDAASFSPSAAIIRLTADGSWPYVKEAPPRVDPSCKGR